MKKFTQDQVEQIVTDLLINISTMEDVDSKVAEESLEVLNDPMDNIVFSGVVMTKVRPTIFEQREIDLKSYIMSCIQKSYDVLSDCNASFNTDIEKELWYKNVEKSYNTKMQFALSQFANAFYAYDNLEKKYPELMKFI